MSTQTLSPKPLAATTALTSDQLNQHFLNRLTFGISINEYKAIAQKGRDRFIEEQLTPSVLTDPVADLPLDRYDYSLQEIQSWWIEKMYKSERQLLEKMTLFWHNFFATGNHRVKNPYLMYVQNQTIRTNALYTFRNMLTSMSIDPAMLIWLHGQDNNAGYNGAGGYYAPNENFSREVLQRFSMGAKSIAGKTVYSEVDIHEGARAWSGWVVNPEPPYAVTFDPYRHDGRDKLVLGTLIPGGAGQVDVQSMINIIMAYPSAVPGITQCAYWVCRRLIQAFVTGNPVDSYVNTIAQSFGPDGDIKAVLRAIFASTEFQITTNFRCLTKAPVDLYLSSLRLLELDFHTPDHERYLDRLAIQGQELFNHLSVFGWQAGSKWYSFPDVIERLNLTRDLCTEPGYAPLDLVAQVPVTIPSAPAGEVYQYLLKLTLQGMAPSSVGSMLYNDYFIAAPLSKSTATKDPERVRGLLTLLTACPEFSQY